MWNALSHILAIGLSWWAEKKERGWVVEKKKGFLEEWWGGSCSCYRFKANCPLVGPGHTGEVPSVGVFLRDSTPYLCEFRRKPWKTPNGLVDKRKLGLNLALPVYQLWVQYHSSTSRAEEWGRRRRDVCMEKCILLKIISAVTSKIFCYWPWLRGLTFFFL